MTAHPNPEILSDIWDPAFEAFRGRRALVTGGAGFIGSHLVDALVALGAEVAVLDNFATGKRANLAQHGDSIALVEGDIRDIEACRSALGAAAGDSGSPNEPPLLFHQAALGSVPRSLADPATSLAVNVSGTANVFAAARDAGVTRVVYASSSSVYGDSPTRPKREGEEGRALSPYAVSKIMDEDLADIFGRCYGMEFVGLRYFNVYGPRQDPQGPYAAVIPRFFQAYLEGRAPVIFGDGEQSRDFTPIADVVQANLRGALALPASCGRAYNVAVGQAISVNRLAAEIRSLCGGGPDPDHHPERAGDIRHSLADLSNISSGLGYVPRLTMPEALSRSLAYYAALQAPR
jgi:nucleoside-diphosphate-sugar epimerase